MSSVVEIWKDVVGYPLYQVSDQGRVRRGEKFIQPFPVKGYPAFNVSNGKSRKSLRVHREIAKAFLGVKDGELVRHLDGKTANACLSNLAPGTGVENEADKRLHGTALIGSRHHMSKLTEKDVLEIRKSSEPGIVLADKFGVKPTTICAIRKQRKWRHLCS